MTSNLPKFLCIGVQKAATSWLWVQLRSHPDVWMPPVKELHFFDHLFVPENRKWTGWHIKTHIGKAIKWHREKGKDSGPYFEYLQGLLAEDMFTEAWYRRAFQSPSGTGKFTGDITPEYCMIPEEGVRYVERLLGRPKIILNIRHPVSRAVSQIRMNAQRRGINLDCAAPGDWQTLAEDPVILSRARYSIFPDQWRNIFGQDNFHVIEYQDISRNPSLVMHRLEGFLGLRNANYAKVDERVHEGVPLKSSVPVEVLAHLTRSLQEEISAYEQLRAEASIR